MNTARLMGTGVISALAASLCCIMPVLALIAGSSSIAANFSWIEPARPYLIGVTIAVLGFAWYQKLKPQPVDECGCAVDEKPRFFQSKTFLLIVTVFAVLMMSFPYYAKAFFPKNDKSSVVTTNSKVEAIEFGIKGMTCEACEEHVKMEVNKLSGIVSVDVSYPKRNAIVQFNPDKTDAKQITEAINSTGYKVISQTSKN
jgi:mercuric ion transport protein